MSRMKAMTEFLGLLLLGLSVSSLELTGPYQNVAKLGSDSWVPCWFTVDKPVDPNHLTIFWHFLDKEILIYNKTVRTTSPRYSLSTEELLTGVADLTISNIQIPDGGGYKCSVIYNSERKEKSIWLDVRAPPQVTITDKTVVVNEESVLCCSATGFYPPGIEVKWFRGSVELRDVTLNDPQMNPDRTYSVNSTVTITPTEEDSEQNFLCRVRHFHLTDPLQVDFQLVYEDRISAEIVAACSVSVVILILLIAVLGWRWKSKGKERISAGVIAACSVLLVILIIIIIAVRCWRWKQRGKDVSAEKIVVRLIAAYFVLVVILILILIAVLWWRWKQRGKDRISVGIVAACSVFLVMLILLIIAAVLRWRQKSKEKDRIEVGIVTACSVSVVILIIIIAAFLWWRWKQWVKDYRWTPAVGEIQVPRLLLGSPAVLQCDISGYFPDVVTVTWMRLDGDKLHKETDDNQRITSRRVADNTYSRTASLTITPDLWTHQGAEYICRVEHPSLRRPIWRSTGRLQVYAKPKISHPMTRNLQISERIKYSLNLEKFYPKSIKINWTCGERGTEEVLPFTELVTENPDRSYNVSSEVIIPEDRHKDPRLIIRVTWNHESMEEPEFQELSIRDSDYRWSPVVGEIEVPPLLLGSPAVLQCDISGYFPDAVTVTWMRRDGDKLHEETADNQRITSRRAADNTYSRTASLTITPDLQTHQGAEYICLVEHPSLETPIE